MLTAFLVALAARIVVAVFIAVALHGRLFLDDVNYVSIARDFSAGHTSAWDAYTTFVFHRNLTFLLPMSSLFYLFGPHALLGQLLSACFGALTAALVTRLLLEGTRRSTALLGGLAVALYPSQVLFSSLALKDALVWAALAGAAVLVALVGRSHGRRLLLVCGALVVVLVLLGFLRQHTLLVTCGALVLAAAGGDARDRWLRLAGAILLMVLVPFAVGAGPAGAAVLSGANPPELQRALGATGASTAVVSDATSSDAAASALRRAKERRARAVLLQALATATAPTSVAGRAVMAQRLAQAKRALAEADDAQREANRLAALAAKQAAQRGSGAGAGSLTANLAYLPRGLAVMILEPYPWRSAGNARLLLARAESVLWYPLLGFALVGMTRLRELNRILVFPTVVGAGTATMWALVEGNFGTAYRHRGEFVWVVVALAAVGFERLRLWVAHRRDNPTSTGGTSA